MTQSSGQNAKARWPFAEYVLGLTIFVIGLIASIVFSFQESSAGNFRSLLSLVLGVVLFFIADKIGTSIRLHELSQELRELREISQHLREECDAALLNYKMLVNRLVEGGAGYAERLPDGDGWLYLSRALQSAKAVQNFGFLLDNKPLSDPDYKTWVDALATFISAGGTALDEIIIKEAGASDGREIIDVNHVHSTWYCTSIDSDVIPKPLPILCYTIIQGRNGDIETLFGWGVERGMAFNLPVFILRGEAICRVFQHHFQCMKRFAGAVDQSKVRLIQKR